MYSQVRGMAGQNSASVPLVLLYSPTPYDISGENAGYCWPLAFLIRLSWYSRRSAKVMCVVVCYGVA